MRQITKKWNGHTHTNNQLKSCLLNLVYQFCSFCCKVSKKVLIDSQQNVNNPDDDQYLANQDFKKRRLNIDWFIFNKRTWNVLQKLLTTLNIHIQVGEANFFLSVGSPKFHRSRKGEPRTSNYKKNHNFPLRGHP